MQVDEKWQPIPGTEEIIPCDTLLLSVGLIPENELSRKAGVLIDPITGGPYVDNEFQTNIEGIFCAGNVVHVYDLVDWVTQAGYIAGKAAAVYAQGSFHAKREIISIQSGSNVRYVVPHKIDKSKVAQEEIRLQLRASSPIEQPVWLEVTDGKNLITRRGQPYTRPGEMVTIPLKPGQYSAVQQAQELFVNISPR
jgi:hypothetical protein